MRYLASLATLVCLLGLVPSGRAQAQVEISPRLALADALNSRRDQITLLAGVRARKVRPALSPFGALYLRTTSVTGDGIDESVPSGSGLHAVLGFTVEWSEPGKMSAHASLGSGMVFWRNPAWGEEFVVELEGGFTIPTSESSGLLIGLRLERMADQGTLGAVMLGGAWRVGG